MNQKMWVIPAILAAGILGAAIFALLPVGLVRAPATSAAILKADHSLFTTDNGDKGVTCTSNQGFQIEASVTNFDNVTHILRVKFLGPGGPDSVDYLVPSGGSLTIGGFGRSNSTTPDESSTIAVLDNVTAISNPGHAFVGWVSAWSPAQPVCLTI